MRAQLVDGGRPAVRLLRERGGLLRVETAIVQVAGSGGVTLQPPRGWAAHPLDSRRWRVWPLRLDLDRPARFTVTAVDSGSGVVRTSYIDVSTTVDVTSDFDPAKSALLVRNRAAELGEFRPRRDVFDRTWGRMPQPMARLLYEGLYSDVVFLSSGPVRGGLCSGMARWALARALGQEPAPVSQAAAVERIAQYHGRQLRDRALLSALPWFVRASPAAAFRAVRTDLLTRGISDRALDLAVPKPWRRDVARALVAEGHTVVPVRLRQSGGAAGTLDVYDPNHPEAVGSEHPRTITFNLASDRYGYGSLVGLEQDNVGIVAVRQRAYASSGTAILATLGSLVLYPRRGIASLRARVGVRS